MSDTRTQLTQTIDSLLSDIDARKTAKIQQAEQEADEEIGAIIARIQEPVSLLPLIRTETATSSPGMFHEVTVPPMPAEEPGD